MVASNFSTLRCSLRNSLVIARCGYPTEATRLPKVDDDLTFPPEGDAAAERGVIGSIFIKPDLAGTRLVEAQDFTTFLVLP